MSRAGAGPGRWRATSAPRAGRRPATTPRVETWSKVSPTESRSRNCHGTVSTRSPPASQLADVVQKPQSPSKTRRSLTRPVCQGVSAPAAIGLAPGRVLGRRRPGTAGASRPAEGAAPRRHRPGALAVLVADDHRGGGVAGQVVQQVALGDEVAVLGVPAELLVLGLDHGQQMLLHVGQGQRPADDQVVGLAVHGDEVGVHVEAVGRLELEVRRQPVGDDAGHQDERQGSRHPHRDVGGAEAAAGHAHDQPRGERDPGHERQHVEDRRGEHDLRERRPEHEQEADRETDGQILGVAPRRPRAGRWTRAGTGRAASPGRR